MIRNFADFDLNDILIDAGSPPSDPDYEDDFDNEDVIEDRAGQEQYHSTSSRSDREEDIFPGHYDEHKDDDIATVQSAEKQQFEEPTAADNNIPFLIETQDGPLEADQIRGEDILASVPSHEPPPPPALQNNLHFNIPPKPSHTTISPTLYKALSMPNHSKLRYVSKVRPVSSLNFDAKAKPVKPSSTPSSRQAHSIPHTTVTPAITQPYINKLQGRAIPIQGLILGARDINLVDPMLITKETNHEIFPKSVATTTASQTEKLQRVSSQKRVYTDTEQDDYGVSDAMFRLGTDKYGLMDLYERVHSNFIADMTDICRKRAKGSRSAEELAMHKVLSDFVLKNFGGVDAISRLRMEMIAAAVDASLHSTK